MSLIIIVCDSSTICIHLHTWLIPFGLIAVIIRRYTIYSAPPSFWFFFFFTFSNCALFLFCFHLAALLRETQPLLLFLYNSLSIFYCCVPFYPSYYSNKTVQKRQEHRGKYEEQKKMIIVKKLWFIQYICMCLIYIVWAPLGLNCSIYIYIYITACRSGN